VLSEETKNEIKFQTKLSSIKSYQELSRVQNEVFKEKLSEKENSLQKIQSNTEKIKISLIVLVALIALSAVGGIGYYLSKDKKKNLKSPAK
jgi:hypothetical protein